MSDYRNEFKEFEKEARWTFFKGMPLFLLVIVSLSVVGFALNSFGVFGKTAVERKVFENSYQRSEALKSQIATNEAVISEIENKLLNPNLEPNTRFNLQAQLSAARVRINTARSKQ